MAKAYALTTQQLFSATEKDFVLYTLKVQKIP
jgi:hypothetical protein